MKFRKKNRSRYGIPALFEHWSGLTTFQYTEYAVTEKRHADPTALGSDIKVHNSSL
jgi:hypothetical protein